MSENDETRSLLGAYALDAVDDLERQAVERLVASDDEAADELRSLQAVAARLGESVRAEPPAALRASVLGAIAAEAAGQSRTPRHAAEPATDQPGASSTEARPTSDEQVSRPAPVTHRPRGAQRWWSLAAAVVVGAAVPSAIAIQQHQRAEHATTQQQALADVLRDPSAVLAHGEVQGGGSATAVLTDDDALFSATGLPSLSDGKVYQLWVVSKEAAASAGVLSADGGSVRQLAGDFSSGDALAMTVEPAGGSQQPTTTPLVILSAS